MLRNLKKSALATAAAGALLVGLGVGSANAQMALDDITIDLSGLDGLPGTAGSAAVGPTAQSTISSIEFVGIFDYHVLTFAGGTPNGVPDPGETFGVRGLVKATGYDGFGANDNPTDNGRALGGSAGYEMTFFFDVGGFFTSVTGSSINFNHNDADSAGTPGAGKLEVWIDNFNDGDAGEGLGDNDPPGATTHGTETAYRDGVKIAEFKVIPGVAATVTVDTVAGDDVIMFQATYLMPGVWTDEFGLDLSTKCLPGPDGTLETAMGDVCEATDEYAFATNTTSVLTFDQAFEHTPQFAPYEALGGPFECTDKGLGGGAPTTSGEFSCGFEQGGTEFLMLAVPEPSTVAAFGIGLLGLAGLARRRRKAA